MKNLIAFPILVLVVILQSSVVSRIALLSGYADLMLLILAAWALQEQVRNAWHWAVLGGILVGFVSGLSWLIPLTGYLLTVALAQLFQRRVWQAPLLAMFAVIFLGTLCMHVLSLVALSLSGNPLPLGEALGLVTMPCLLLNFLFAAPIYVLMKDLAGWLYPLEVVV